MKLTKSRLKEIVREEIQAINEVDFSKIKLPSVVNRFLDKLLLKQLKQKFSNWKDAWGAL